MEEHPQKKKTLCRFFLRGLCIYNSHQCPFSHGVWDLNYDYYKEGEYIDYDYHINKDDAQKNYIKGPRIYKDLYQFQGQKTYSLDEINENRVIRNEIRQRRHQQLYQQFMQLLEVKYPGTAFTEEFLIRQFTRVGFNRILMGVIKFSHIQANLCEAQGSLYFKTTQVVPPENKKQAVLVRKAPEEEIIATYKEQYKKIIEKSQNPLEESIIKKLLFTAKLPINIPPLNLIMKDYKTNNFPQFLKTILGEETNKIIFEASIEVIQEEATSYLKQHLSERLVTWNELYVHLTKILKTNNANVINQVKPNLILEHNILLFFPSNQFIFNAKYSPSIFKNLKEEPCKCPFQKLYPEQELLLDGKNVKQLKQKQSYDINNFESLMLCAPHILNSEILGVDLEGNLRKGGFVEMIQLNNGKNTFLIDIWDLNEKADFETFWLARKVLRNVMANPKILKIFHDCRHDSIGLHEMIETCVVNVFDTSASQTLIMQLDQYNKLFNKEKEHKDIANECKQIVGQLTQVKTPGLNEILKKYEARHGVNQNKDKYHKMWSKGETSFFCKRPIDPDYRQYCIKDVLDLPEVYQKMIHSIPQQARDLAYWISGLYAQSAFQPQKK